MVSSIMRDLFTEDYDRILIDDTKVYQNIRGYVEAIAPQMAGAVKLHRTKQPIFETVGIEKQVQEAFEKRVNMPSGGYLIIETTEAMHVVDVNSGRAGRGLSQSENLLRVNLEAADVLAKQLRLRDLGGIICGDFIDMKSPAHRRKLYDALQKAFEKDRAVTKVLPMSDFGVVQITRQRLRPSITVSRDDEGGDVRPPEPLQPRQTPLPAKLEAEMEEQERSHDERKAQASRPAQTGEAQTDEPDTSHRELRAPRAIPQRTSTAPTVVHFDADQPTASDVVAELERWLRFYRSEVGERFRKRPILIQVHPFMGAYLNKGLPSTLLRWKLRIRGIRFQLDVDDSMSPLAFEIRDEKSGKPLTKKYDPDDA